MLYTSTSISITGYTSDVITEDHLGTNFLFIRDRAGPDSDYHQVIEQIDAEVLRYPGGTMTEEYFDITDPDGARHVNIVDVMHGSRAVPREQTVEELSDFIDYVNQIGGDPIIVLPTYRFYDLQTGGILASAEADVRQFIRELLTGQYGDISEVTLELGNEFYQGRFNWTTAEYADLQAHMAEWIDDEATALGLREDVTLLAQAGRNLNENTTLSNAFLGQEDTVDGVITHFYGSNSTGNTLGIGGGVGRRLEQINEVWTPLLGEDMTIAVTEWSVGEDGEDNTLINGIMRSAPLLRMFVEMIENGVDIASIWSAQTGGPAGLSGHEGTGSDLTPTGYFYSMLAESVEGLSLVNTGTDFRLYDSQHGSNIGYSYTFAAEGRSVSYFASGVNSDVTVTVDMTDLLGDGTYVFARSLDVAEGWEVTDYWSQAVITFDTNLVWTEIGGRTYLELDMSAYEMIEVHVVQDQGVGLSGDTKNDVSDVIQGSTFGDEILGHGGRDVLDGGIGDDELHGGRGVDVLFGGDGSDKLFGGYQIDTLNGGDGDDYLYGESGADYMQGGVGTDRLAGENGDDRMYGDLGHDLLFGGKGGDILFGGNGDDRLLGENGSDRLYGDDGSDLLYGGRGSDELSGGDGDDRLLGENGLDRLFGGNGDDLLLGQLGLDFLSGGAGNDTLDGGGAADFLIGGAGDDRLTGGLGQDMFVMRSLDIGSDLITDFQHTLDRVDLTDFEFRSFRQIENRLDQVGDDVTLFLGRDVELVFEDTQLQNLSENNFIL